MKWFKNKYNTICVHDWRFGGSFIVRRVGTCFAQHDRITTNAHQRWTKPRQRWKIPQKLKPKNSSQSFGRSSCRPSPFWRPKSVLSSFRSFSRVLSNIYVGYIVCRVECGNQRTVAADYIIYFKQTHSLCTATKQTFLVFENKEIPLGSSPSMWHAMPVWWPQSQRTM